MPVTLVSERTADEVLYEMWTTWNMLRKDVEASTIDRGRMAAYMDREYFSKLSFKGEPGAVKSPPPVEEEEVSDEDLERLLDEEDEEEEDDE